ncbi:hypothetical protein ABI59_19705 [Acidobacteria bacterium Mor1]|nr:hypothetical protein ABI59_19705 [Acidobacteria bacterium Mor1]
MGSVYRAYDRVTHRDVALKVLDEPAPAGPGHPLSGEFAAWTGLRHPNIVQVLGLEHAAAGPIPEGAPYLVMEYFPGKPAHQALRPGEVPGRALEELARRILLGLHHVHQAGLVHRDLKPANVLVSGRRVGPTRIGPGRVKLTDFGLAERQGLREDPGRLSGSLPYVAPEAITGGAVDGRTDLYGLGILLFLLATGHLPQPVLTPDEVVRWHLSGEVPDPRGYRPELGERLARLIQSLMARQRDERPADAGAALTELGVRPPGPAPSIGRPAGMADRAALRLAVDAVRLGACRVVTLESSATRARKVVEEARILAGIHGLQACRLGRADGCHGLGRLVLRLLLQRGAAARRLVRRHRLDAGLPLELLGGVPVWSTAALRSPGRKARASHEELAGGVAAFILEASRRRAMVLEVTRPALEDTLCRQVVRRLARKAARRHAPTRSGGMLLLLEREVQDRLEEDQEPLDPPAAAPRILARPT